MYVKISKTLNVTVIFAQIFPENVIKIVRKFADDVVGSLRFALKHVPDNLAYVKMKRKSRSA